MNKTILMPTKYRTNEHRTRTLRREFLGRQPVERARNSSELRIVLYSHDTMGIGHMRRNLLIAQHLKNEFPAASILVIAGAKEATTFSRAAGIDCLTLPAFQKQSNGTYESRSLAIPAEEVLDVRAQTIRSAIQSYQPDLLIVDKIAGGAGGELLPSLEWLKTQSDCFCVLGLRDILDSADKVVKDWKRLHFADIVRSHFQSIWIYGDPKVYNAVKEYRLAPDLAERTTFTGYLDPRLRLNNENHDGPIESETPFVLCTVGGGQDGQLLPGHFIEAMSAIDVPAVLLTGPCMPARDRAALRRQAETLSSIRVIEFVEEGDTFVRNASHVIAMGGYNTLSAILAYRKPALIVPRVTPRQEQAIRAERLESLGLVNTIHPDQLNAQAIRNWLASSPQPDSDSSTILNMNGLSRIGELVQSAFPKLKPNGCKHDCAF